MRINSGRVLLRSVLAGFIVVFSLGSGFALDRGKPTSTPALRPRSTSATYKIDVGLEGEVYPFFANYASLQRPQERDWGTVSVTVTNSTSSPLQNRISVQVMGWSDEEVQTAEMAAGEVRTYLFAPTFWPRLYSNREIAAGTALVNVRDLSGKLIFTQTVPVRLRSADDIYWGPQFEYAPFIASWVTPHDPLVEKVLSQAKEFTPGRRLPGYESSKNAAQQERSTYIQAEAIYRALHAMGLSYVKSSLAFGGHAELSERVRTPRETLNDVSANCIDGAVMYASLFENLGMEPIVVLVPRHAYVGLRVAPNSVTYLFIETSLTGRGTFQAAVRSAESGLARYRNSQIVRIPISDARQAGIYPMPEATSMLDAGKPVLRSLN